MASTFPFSDFKSGQILQVCFVVPDIDAAMRFYAEVLRIGPFSCARGFRAPDGWYRGSNAMPELTIAQACTGSYFIELIQQHDDTPSVYKEFIDKHGYGIHHYGVAVATEDFDSLREHYFNLGFEDIFTDNLPGGVRIRYMGPKGEEALEKARIESGVSYYECIEIVNRQDNNFSRLYEAYRQWDGKTLTIQRQP
ncbi:MAG: VOC family protein [Clostridiales bacterium]|nr:VOC family protein [Clostridiales bacterium]